MDVRIVGACAAVGGGLCALVAVAVIVFMPASVAPIVPSDSLLIAQGGTSDNYSGSAPRERLRARVPASAIPDVAMLTPPDASVSPPRDGAKPNGSARPSAPPKVLETPSASIPDQPAPEARKPKPPRPPVDHKYDGVFTMDEIRKVKAAMRLSPDQEANWGPVANLLRELGRQQMAQVDAGQKPDLNLGMDMMQRFYTAASPLLQSLREDQKVQVRRLAKDMGLGAYASYI